MIVSARVAQMGLTLILSALLVAVLVGGAVPASAYGQAMTQPREANQSEQSDGIGGGSPLQNLRIGAAEPSVPRGPGSQSPRDETCPTGRYLAQYYNNTSLSGSPVRTVLCEDPPLDHDWGAGSPGDPVNADNFSARWTGRFLFEQGTYRFVATADDGVRVSVDGTRIIDQWRDGAPTEFSASVTLTAGEHQVVMEYYERGGGAVARLRWEKLAGCPTGQYLAEYFNNPDLAGSPTFTRCESTSIDYDWRDGGPGNGVGNDNFSVRWSGRLRFIEGPYLVELAADDGLRIFVNGQTAINEWRDGVMAPRTLTAAVPAGEYDFRVEYYERGGNAMVKFRWRLFCPDGQFLAEYFNTPDLTGAPVLAACDSAPFAHDWGGGSPGPAVNADGFSARWTGRFTFEQGSYRFIARTDDGVRVYVDGTGIIDQWRDQGPTESRACVALTAGPHEVKVEYYERGAGAMAELRWEPGCSTGGWVTIVAEDFEGSFPGAWRVSDNNGPSSGEYTWAKRSCRAFSGGNSGWAVGGGANGGSLPCGSNYPDNAAAWMVYGPFSLAGATDGELAYKLWLNSERTNETKYDGVCRGASIDGRDYRVLCTAGNTQGWIDRTLDLKNIAGLGNLMGRDQVWVALMFISDGSDNRPEGGFVDDIVLRKYVGGQGMSEPAVEIGQPKPSGEQLVETVLSATLGQ